jgi:hypothetical protein
VAQALSRLCRQGEITRLGKGLYYRPRETLFGTSSPAGKRGARSAAIRSGQEGSGRSAANHLGFTTQNPGRRELATSRTSVPRILNQRRVLVHPRRPASWKRLSETDAALLDILRRRGETSELSADKTVARLLRLCSAKGRFLRFVRVAASEPPRVRAMLGAIGQSLRQPPPILQRLRRSLNPLSRFDFGILHALPFARVWQSRPAGEHS